MQLGTPSLVFIGTAMAIGAVCLSYLKARLHTTNHHLMVFAVVAAIGYLAPLHIERASQLERERLKHIWAGTARAFAHELERVETGSLEQVEAPSLQRVVSRASERHSISSADLGFATLITRDPGGVFRRVTVGLGPDIPDPKVAEDCNPKIEEAFNDREVWCEEASPSGETTGIKFLVPLRDHRNSIEGVLMIQFSVANWRTQQAMAEWRVVAEFLGLLSICVLMAGLLISAVENRRRQEMEKAVSSLKAEVEDLDGMVNAVNGVVWQRSPNHHQRFTFVSQQADGCFGYSMEQWTAERGFLKEIIESGDLPRIEAAWQQALAEGRVYHVEYRVRRADGGIAHVVEHGQAARLPLHGTVLRGIMMDVTTQREAEAAIQNMHRLMLDASRQAGMAEIATGVLHNVGNVLNSLNVGAKLLLERMQRSRMDRLCDAAGMLKEHLPGDMQFFVSDKRGQALPGYLDELANYLRDEQHRLTASVSDILQRVDSIRDVIMLQQTHSKVHALKETLDLATIMEDALRLDASANNGQTPYQVVRQYADLPPVQLTRSLLLQILVNLLSNASQAMAELPPEHRRLTLRIGPNGADGLRIVVEDNGCGMAKQDLIDIFRQGCPTKGGGQGFGLHHASLLADDLGGSLRAESEGRGKGARFILDLPVHQDTQAPAATTAPDSAPATLPSL